MAMVDSRVPVASGTKISLPVTYDREDALRYSSLSSESSGEHGEKHHKSKSSGHKNGFAHHVEDRWEKGYSKETQSGRYEEEEGYVSYNSEHKNISRKTSTPRVNNYDNKYESSTFESNESAIRPNSQQGRSKVNNWTEYVNGPDQIIPSTDLFTSDVYTATKIRMETKGPGAMEPLSVPTHFIKIVDRFPGKPAIAVKREGVWKSWTYQEYYNDVRTVAKAFIKLGLDRLHGVCILGFNSPEWFISNFATIFSGGCAAGIYTTNSPDACLHCAINCDAQIIVVEDKKQLAKILEIRPKLPSLRAIVQYSGKPTEKGVYSWDDIMELGRRETEEMLNDRLKRICINQPCTLIYTSGTTGLPKGVMLSHDNLTFTVRAAAASFKALEVGKECLVSYLPLSHVAGQLLDMYLPIEVAGSVFFAMPDALKGSLGETLKEVRPTVFLGVPRVWEKIYEKMQEIGKQTKGLKKQIATWAKKNGLKYAISFAAGNPRETMGFKMAEKIVLSKIKAALGLDRCKLCVTGAAPLSTEILTYFYSLNIKICNIYGMSECTGPETYETPVPGKMRIGTVGNIMPGAHIKLHEKDREGNGEVCMNGRHVFMGYLKMPEKTDEATDSQGWLHSGDIGLIDKDGFLSITGRIKELIITAGGENIPPVLIEDAIKAELPVLSNAMLIGDKKKFLSILLTLKSDMNIDTGEPLDTLSKPAIEWCRERGANVTTVSEFIASQDDRLMSAIQEGIDKYNATSHSNAQKVQKWTILSKDFSVPGEELGPTLKLKRSYVAKKYEAIIERFYA